MRQVTLKDGKVMTVYDSGEFVSDQIQSKGDYFEIEELSEISAMFPNQSTILEIGANIGNHAAFYEKYLKFDRLVCFEPIKWNADLLRQNTSHEVVECGLWHEETRVNFNVYNDNMGCCQVGTPNENGIELKTLDSFQFTDVTFIKIDVENAESHVLAGAIQTLIINKPTLWIEANLTISYLSCNKILHSLGYAMVKQLGNQSNFLYIHESNIQAFQAKS